MVICKDRDPDAGLRGNLSVAIELSVDGRDLAAARRYEFINVACYELTPHKRTLGIEGREAARIGSGRRGGSCVRSQPFNDDQPVRRARNSVLPSVRRDLEIFWNPASVIHARYWPSV